MMDHETIQNGALALWRSGALALLVSLTLHGVSTKKRLVPTKLKQLAEKRARVSGELEAERPVNQSYLGDVTALKEKLRVATAIFDKSNARFTRLQDQLAKIDADIIAIAPSVNPAAIPTIRAWSGRYGKRGALRDFLMDTLTQRYPDFVDTTELSKLVIARFTMTFESPRDRMKWYDSSFRNALKVLAKNSLIERGGCNRARPREHFKVGACSKRNHARLRS